MLLSVANPQPSATGLVAYIRSRRPRPGDFLSREQAMSAATDFHLRAEASPGYVMDYKRHKSSCVAHVLSVSEGGLGEGTTFRAKHQTTQVG